MSRHFTLGIVIGALLGTSNFLIVQHRRSTVPQNVSVACAKDTPNGDCVSLYHGHNDRPQNYYQYPDVLYAHLHMAKTAGTTLNGEMAARYERVCGHKGYSYDFYQGNNRTQGEEFAQDSFSKLHGPDGQGVPYGRGRVPPNLMDEIGYEGKFVLLFAGFFLLRFVLCTTI